MPPTHPSTHPSIHPSIHLPVKNCSAKGLTGARLDGDSGICGNGVCEAREGEPASAQHCPADCPDVSSNSCPVPSPAAPAAELRSAAGGGAVGAVGQACSGRGKCILLAEACSCFTGYAGPTCNRCADGFIDITNSAGTGACSCFCDMPGNDELDRADGKRGGRGGGGGGKAEGTCG